MILPEMPKAEFDRLAADIRAKGLMRPITTFEGKILDGRHRFRACAEVGVSPRFEAYTGTDPQGFVASSCVHRSLNASQRALIAAGFLAYEREQAKDRMAVGGAVGGKSKGVEDFPPPSADSGKARDKAGERMHVSGRTVDDAAKVMEKAVPEVLEKVRSGEMALNEAKKVVTLNVEAQRRVAEAPKKDRRAVMRKAVNLRDAAKRRAQPPQVAKEPSTAFVRKLLGAFDRITSLCAEEGLKDASSIAKRFLDEMDWEDDALTTALERFDHVIRAMTMIRLRAKVA